MPDLPRALAALQRMAVSIGADAYGPLAVDEFNVTTVARDYEVRLSEYVADVFNGEWDAGELALSHRQLIRSYGFDVYLEGLRDGGIDEPERHLTAEDEQRIYAFIQDQLGYVTDFAADAQAARELPTVAERAKAQRAVNARVKLWGQRMAEHGRAGTASARANRMASWVLGKADHCADCLHNSGLKPHRMSYWLRRGLPRSRGLACGGFNCACTLLDPKTGEILYP